MAGTKFKLNHGTMQGYIDGRFGVEALLEAKAQQTLSAAKASAPVDEGEHRDSGHIETDHTDRMRKKVVFDSDHSLIVEANTGHIARSI